MIQCFIISSKVLFFSNSNLCGAELLSPNFSNLRSSHTNTHSLSFSLSLLMATFSSCSSSSLLQLKPSPSKLSGPTSSFASINKVPASNGCMRAYGHQKKFQGIRREASSTLVAPQAEDIKECSRPKWTEFELGKSPVYWRTSTGLAPASGDTLTLFYNPAATSLVPDEVHGIAFNGGFNQPIMCGGEPRVMTRKDRGSADSPYYTIKIRVPRHAVNLIFSFTNGKDWDGQYKLQFQVLKSWRNMPISFFNEGLAKELSADGACDKAIFPDSNPILSCSIGNLYIKGGESCKLNLVKGCTDPDSPLFDPLATVDDGSCPLESDSDEE